MPADITVELINEFLEFVRNKSIQDGFANDLINLYKMDLLMI